MARGEPIDYIFNAKIVTANNELRKSIVEETKKLIGLPGVNHDHAHDESGCSLETGFDCSGLALYVLAQVHIFVPDTIRHCSEFFDHFGVFVHYGLHQDGDLVFFARSGDAPTHMGIMIDDMRYVHSPGKKGSKVKVATLQRKPLPVTSPKQLYLENPIGFKRPVINLGRWNEPI